MGMSDGIDEQKTPGSLSPVPERKGLFDDIYAQPQTPRKGLFDDIYGAPDSIASPEPEGSIWLKPKNVIPAPEPEEKSTLGALGKTALRIPENILAKGIQAVQGQEGASVTDQGLADKYVNWVEGRNRKLAEEYEGAGDVPFTGGLIPKKAVAELGPNLAYSAATMAASAAGGAGAGVLAIPTGPGAVAAATAGSMAAGGTAAHRMTGYQVMNDWLARKNEESIKQFGRGITPDEEAQFKENFSNLATESGLWEAGPEAVGNVLEMALMKTPLGKIAGWVPKGVGGKIAKEALRFAGLNVVEAGTESVTQMGQQKVEAKAGQTKDPSREWTNPDDWIKSMKEVLPAVLLQSGVMSAGGAVWRKLSPQEGGENAPPTPQDIEAVRQAYPNVTEGVSDEDIYKALMEPKGRPLPTQEAAFKEFMSESGITPASAPEDVEAATREWYASDVYAALQQPRQAIPVEAMPQGMNLFTGQPIDEHKGNEPTPAAIPPAIPPVTEAAVIPDQEPAATPLPDVAPTLPGIAPAAPAEDLGKYKTIAQKRGHEIKLAEKQLADLEEAVKKDPENRELVKSIRKIRQDITRKRAELEGMKSENLPAKEGEAIVGSLPELDKQAHEAATSPLNQIPQPTEAQKEAGNYQKGHVNLHGLDISIENPKGSTRSGKSPEGKVWQTTMKSHYGYIKGTVGKDKDHIDVFIGPAADAQNVYVVDQVDPKTGKFDEHKVVMGQKSMNDAKMAYLENHEPGWQGMGSITEVSMDDFKTWLKKGDTKKPYGKQLAKVPAEAAGAVDTEGIDAVIGKSSDAIKKLVGAEQAFVMKNKDHALAYKFIQAMRTAMTHARIDAKAAAEQAFSLVDDGSETAKRIRDTALMAVDEATGAITSEPTKPASAHETELEDIRKKAIAAGAKEGTPEFDDMVKAMGGAVRKRAVDPLTGWQGAVEFAHAQPKLFERHLENPNQPFSMIAWDVSNVSGMNNAFGQTKADVHIKAIYDIVRVELEKLSKQVQNFRPKGDEGYNAVPDTREASTAAMTRAQQQVQEYARKNGLDTLENQKSPGAPGVDIVFKVEDYNDWNDHESLMNSADIGVEEAKRARVERIRKETGYDDRKTGETGVAAPEGQAGGVETGPGAEAEGIGKEEKPAEEVAPTEAPTAEADPEKPNWLDALPDDQKEKVFTEMRALRERADSYHEKARKLAPKGGEIAAGAADFDEFIRGEAYSELLGKINKGMSPEDAGAAAKQYILEAVEKHNKKRPKDIAWGRATSMEDSTIDDAVRRLRVAAKGEAAPPAAPMTRERFVNELSQTLSVKFGPAKFEMKESKLARKGYEVWASFPGFNTVIKEPDTVNVESKRQVAERAADAAFDWWRDEGWETAPTAEAPKPEPVAEEPAAPAPKEKQPIDYLAISQGPATKKDPGGLVLLPNQEGKRFIVYRYERSLKDQKHFGSKYLYPVQDTKSPTVKHVISNSEEKARKHAAFLEADQPRWDAKEAAESAEKKPGIERIPSPVDEARKVREAQELPALKEQAVTNGKIKTVTGREIPAPPAIRTDTSQKAKLDLRKLEYWLMNQAIDEAKSRKDDFNLTQFKQLKPGKFSQSDYDSTNLYLFNETDPKFTRESAREKATGVAGIGIVDRIEAAGYEIVYGVQDKASRDNLVGIVSAGRAKRYADAGLTIQKKAEAAKAAEPDVKTKLEAMPTMQKLIAKFKETGDLARGDFNGWTVDVSGDKNSDLRQEVMTLIAGKKVVKVGANFGNFTKTVSAWISENYQKEAPPAAEQAEPKAAEKPDAEPKAPEIPAEETAPESTEKRMSRDEQLAYARDVIKKHPLKTDQDIRYYSGQIEGKEPHGIPNDVWKDAWKAEKGAEAAGEEGPQVTEATDTEKRIAEIDKQLAALQARYENKSAGGKRAGMVPPAIKSDALKSITNMMDKLDAEKKALINARDIGIQSALEASAEKKAVFEADQRKKEISDGAEAYAHDRQKQLAYRELAQTGYIGAENVSPADIGVMILDMVERGIKTEQDARVLRQRYKVDETAALPGADTVTPEKAGAAEAIPENVRRIRLFLSKIKDALKTPKNQGPIDGAYDFLKGAISDARKAGELDQDTINRIKKSGVYDERYMKEVLPEALKGVKKAKIQNTGDALRRYWEMRSERITDSASKPAKEQLEAIQRETNRASLFDVPLAEDATPGAQSLISDIRNNIKPFTEWAGEASGGRRGNSRWRTSPESALLKALEGGERGESPEVIRSRAKAYIELLGSLRQELAGAKTVAEIAEKYTAWREAGDENAKKEWNRNTGRKSTEDLSQGTAGDVRAIYFNSLLRHFQRYKPTDYDTAYRTERENIVETKLKSPLDRDTHKLEDIKREGLPDYREGKDVTPEDLKKTFGFADVTMGKYVNAAVRQLHINHFYDSMMDLAKRIGTDPKGMSLGGTLHVAIGALGHGKYSATYHPDQPHPSGKAVTAINLTRDRGDGAVAHEWGHALDYFLRRTPKGVAIMDRLVTHLSRKYDVHSLRKYVMSFLKGDIFYQGSKRDYKENATRMLRYELRDIQSGKSQRGGSTEFHRDAAAMDHGKGEKGKYWTKPTEMFARAFESTVYDTLEGSNPYLVNSFVEDGKVKPPAYKGTPYPKGDERMAIRAVIDDLLGGMEWTAEGPKMKQEASFAQDAEIKAYTEEIETILKDIDIFERHMKAQAEEKRASEKPEEGDDEADVPANTSNLFTGMDDDALSALIDEEVSKEFTGTEEDQKAVVNDGVKRAEQKTARKQQERSAPVKDEKTFSTVAQEFKDAGVEGVDEALKGLYRLFGGGAVKSFPSGFDEAAYAAAKPHFIAAYKATLRAGKSAGEFASLIVKTMGAKIKPFLMRFMTDVRDGVINLDKPLKETEVDDESATERADRAGRPETVPGLEGVPGVPAGVQAGAGVESVRGQEAGEPAGRKGEPDSQLGGKPDQEREDAGRGEGGGVRGIHAVSDRPAGSGTDSPRVGRAAASDLSLGKRDTLAPEDRNNVIADDETITPAGKSARIKANIAAITLVKRLFKEERNATPEEKKVLQQYVGWGALSEDAFKPDFMSAVDRNNGRPFTFWDQKTKDKFAKWKEDIGDKLHPELGGVLTTSEWNSAKGSTLNAHYTERGVIKAMWSALKRMGFEGGKVLEPAGGVGHFFGLMPQDLADTTQLHGVELDKMSGMIFQKLYPEANIQNTGFENAKGIGDNNFDLVVSNFPFGAYPVFDQKHPDYSNWSIHNYFFARSLDAVKPGGIVAAVTSRFSMDSMDSRVRAYLGERADLIGSIRLPDSAFKQSAGTDVVTDIIFLRKKSETPIAVSNPFRYSERVAPTEDNAKKLASLTKQVLEVSELLSGKLEKKQRAAEENKLADLKKEIDTVSSYLNEYYVKHPDMVLGQPSMKGSMYGDSTYTVSPRAGEDIAKLLDNAIAKLPEKIMEHELVAHDTVQETVEYDNASREGSMVERDGEVKLVEDGKLVSPSWIKGKGWKERAAHYIKIKRSLADLVNLELSHDAVDSDIEAARSALNTVYDGFHKKYGFISEKENEDNLSDDTEFPAVMALEDSKLMPVEKKITSGPKKGETRAINVEVFSKGDIFRKRVNYPFEEPSKADTVNDALQISMLYRNSISLDYMAQLTGRTPEDVRAELIKEAMAFLNPSTGMLESKETYLSGWVKKKLEDAKAAVEENKAYEVNVRELEKVIPKDIPIDQISFKLGSEWVPADVINRFADKVLGLEANLVLEETAQGKAWRMDHRVTDYAKNNTTWGGDGYKGHDLLIDSLNLKHTEVRTKTTDENGNEKSVPDPEKTLEAQEKQRQMQEAFKKFILKDKTVSEQLSKIYNDLYNGTVATKWTVPNIDHFPGASRDIMLRDGQKQGVYRGVRESTMFAHGVGLGKTFLFVSLAMEMKRLRTASKSMIVVQNSTLDSYRRSIKKLYPTAKILIPTQKQRSAEARQKLFGMMRTGDYDIIVVPHSFFNMMPNDPRVEQQYVQEELAKFDAYLSKLSDSEKRGPTAKQIEKAKKGKEAQLLKLASLRQDNSLYFEDLGINALLVDESHNYKRGDFFTKIDHVKGLDRNSSARSFHLLLKARHVQEKTGGKNVILATGTPISNTIAEFWTILRYARPDLLEAYGIEDFDSFISTFAETSTDIEQTATGDFKSVTRLNRFVNGAELLTLWKTVADVVLPEDVDLPNRPKMRTGGPQEIVVPRSDTVSQAIADIKMAMSEWQNLPGQDKRELSWVPLVLYGKARQVSIDPRLMDSSLPDDPGSKLNAVIKKAFQEWQDSADIKGTQFIFSDFVQSSDGKFNLYEEVRNKLVKMGVPRSEIVVIHDLKNDAVRELAFEKFRKGEHRFMIGGTQTLGTGTDIPDLAVAVHHIDVPLRPMDFEQRNGRIVRSGNQNKEVNVFVYGTKDTLDSTTFQVLLSKQKFINQILRGDIQSRTFEDPFDETQMSFTEAMAAFSGRPELRQRFGLETEIRKLESLGRSHFEEQAKAKHYIAYNEEELAKSRKVSLPEAEKAAEKVAKAFPDNKISNLEYDGNETAEGLGAALNGVFHEYEAKVTELYADPQRTSKDARIEFEVKLNGIPVDIRAYATISENWSGTGKERVKTEEFTGVNFMWGMTALDRGMTGHVSTGQGLLTSVISKAKDILAQPDHIRRWDAKTVKENETYKEVIERPFQHEKRLKEAGEELQAVIKVLESKKDDDTAGKKIEGRATLDKILTETFRRKSERQANEAAKVAKKLAPKNGIPIAEYKFVRMSKSNIQAIGMNGESDTPYFYTGQALGSGFWGTNHFQFEGKPLTGFETKEIDGIANIFITGEETAVAPIAFVKPGTGVHKGKTLVFFSDKSAVDETYFRLGRQTHPKATYVTIDGKQGVYLKEGDKTVGVIMPMGRAEVPPAVEKMIEVHTGKPAEGGVQYASVDTDTVKRVILRAFPKTARLAVVKNAVQDMARRGTIKQIEADRIVSVIGMYQADQPVMPTEKLLELIGEETGNAGIRNDSERTEALQKGIGGGRRSEGADRREVLLNNLPYAEQEAFEILARDLGRSVTPSDRVTPQLRGVAEKWEELTGTKILFAHGDDIPIKGASPKKGYIIVSDMLETPELLSQVIAHETFHNAERLARLFPELGKQYKRFADVVRPIIGEAQITAWRNTENSKRVRLGITKILENNDAAWSEYGAHIFGDVMRDRRFYERMYAQDQNLFERFVNFIFQAFKKMGIIGKDAVVSDYYTPAQATRLINESAALFAEYLKVKDEFGATTADEGHQAAMFATGQDLFDITHTDMPMYDSVLASPNYPNADGENYWRKNKGYDWKVVSMSPDEYVRAAAEFFASQDGRTVQENIDSILRTRINRDRIASFVKDGNKLPLPVLEINKYGGNQEGLHRALYAKDQGRQTIPVLLFTIDSPDVSKTSMTFKRAWSSSQPMFSVKKETSPDMYLHDPNSGDLAEKATVPSIDITPAMKESVMTEGQPLFSKGSTMASDVRSLLDRYDDGDENLTVSDLVSEIESMADDSDDAQAGDLLEAVRDYNAAYNEDRFEDGLRGDSDAYEEAFMAAVRKAADQPIFSRDIEGDQPVGHDEVVKTVENLTSQIPALKGKVKVVRTDADFPEHLRLETKSRGFEGTVEGVYDPQTDMVYVVSSQIFGKDRPQEVIKHELAHAGIRNILGSEIKPIFRKIYSQFQGSAEMQKIIADYKIDVADAGQQLTAVDEFIAKHGERYKEQPIFKRLIARVRQLLRDMGFTIQWSDADIINLAGAALKREGIGKDIRFSLKEKIEDLTNTQEFKKWFGDSKVVYENGEPMVVYHGTFKNFEAFIPGGDPGTGKQERGPAIWFSPSPNYLPIGHQLLKDRQEGDYERIIPAFVSIKNPVIVHAEDEKQRSSMQDKYADGSVEFPLIMKHKWVGNLRRDGKDGVLYYYKGKIEEIIAIDPEQIKSATGNAGTFDARNPDIRFSIRTNIADKVAESTKIVSEKTGLADAAEGLKQWFVPTMRSPEHLKAAEELGIPLGEHNRKIEQVNAKLQEFLPTFRANAMDDRHVLPGLTPNESFMHRVDKGMPQPTPDLQKAADYIKKMFDEVRDQIGEVNPEMVENWRENYMPRIVERGQEKEAVSALMARRPLKTKQSFAKQRVFEDIMDLKEFGYKLASDNPVEMVIPKTEEMLRYIAIEKYLAGLKAKGDLLVVHSAKAIPDGYAEIPDRFGTVWYKNDSGELVKGGIRVVPQAHADILNNYLSKSAYTLPFVGGLYKTHMNMAGFLNQVQLGVLSAFHAGFTSTEVTVSHGANVMRDFLDLLRGKATPGELMKSIIETPAAAFFMPSRGKKIMEEWLNPGARPEYAKVAKAIELSMGRAHSNQDLMPKQYEKMLWEKANGMTLRAALRSPLAFIDWSSRWLMHTLVPRQKFAVMGELVDRIIRNNPGKSMEELTPEFRQAWNRIDARIGQVNYERLFMNNVAKNTLQALLRAPGWTGGTIAEIGGAGVDAVKAMRTWQKTGKMPQVSDRVLYTVSLLLTTAVVNGILTKLFTGDDPEGMDFWAFRTGGKDEKGHDERFVLPTYAKDIFAYYENTPHTLLAKMHPSLSMTGDMIRNKEYYGNQIYNPEDFFIYKAADLAKYGVKQFVPFWIRGVQKETERGGGFMETLTKTPLKIIGPEFGVMPATSAYTYSKAEKKINEIMQGKKNIEGRNKQKAEEHDLKLKLRRDLGSKGDAQAIAKAVQEGKITPKAAREIMKSRNDTPLQYSFKHLTIEEALQVVKLTTPEERRQVAPMLAKKLQSIKDRTPDARKDILEQYRKLIG